jgi:hypothetical protein
MLAWQESLGMKTKIARHSMIATALIIVAALLVYVFADQIAVSIANFIYPHLQPPADDEAPPTPTTFPASSEIKAVIGGRGEGLNCSVPLEWLFFRKESNAAPVSLQFRQACAFHDYCYRHGAATYGYEQVDCDFMLIQHAYRLCRQIYAKPERIPYCWSRARAVLAGVRVFGAKSFQAGERSTYFEFDPMPVRADDYAVARLVSPAPGQPRQKVVGASASRDLQRLVVIYRFRRATVQPRLLIWGDAMVSESPWRQPFLFPRQAIPSPPHVLGTNSGDLLLAAARQDVSESGVWNVRFPLASEPAVTTSPSHDSATACAFTDPSAYPEKGPQDSHCSVRQLVANPPKNTRIAPVKFYHQAPHGLELLSLCVDESGYRVVIQPDRLCNSTADPAATAGRCDAGITVPPGEHHDRYRLHQSEPLLGHFKDPNREAVLLLSRGLNAIGKRYEEAALGFLTSLQPRTTTPASEPGIKIELPESSEPVAPVALADARTGLISVVVQHAAGNQAGRTLLELRDLNHCDQGRCATPALLDTKLDDSWARMPIQVMDSLERPNTSLLFFSRVMCRKSANDDVPLESCVNIRPPAYPMIVAIEFRYHRLLAGAGQPLLPELGRGSCRVSLARQYDLDKDTHLVSTLSRALPKNAGDDDRNRIIYSGFARRWNSSQVIPGHIFAQAQPSDMLDVAVIFNGYPGYSLLIAGTGRPAGGAEGFGFEAFSPSYVDCN